MFAPGNPLWGDAYPHRGLDLGKSRLCWVMINGDKSAQEAKFNKHFSPQLPLSSRSHRQTACVSVGRGPDNIKRWKTIPRNPKMLNKEINCSIDQNKQRYNLTPVGFAGPGVGGVRETAEETMP